MKKWNKIISIIAAIVLVLTGACFCQLRGSDKALNSISGDATEEGTLTLHFIDVGQGDCTLIECNGKYALIDAGPDNKGTAIRNYMKKQGVEKLDYLILTHTDADHIGSADSIVSNVDIDTIFMGNFPKDNKVYSSLLNEMKYKNYTWTTPIVGATYELGDASFCIIAPNKAEYATPNNSSISILLTYGDNRFIFTGDCEEEAESEILANGIDISADVYQVGHHGSRTSSSQSFLNAVNPAYAVISCEAGNSYGHPHAETMNKLRAMGVNVFRTDEQGTVICVSDGKSITWNCAPSTTWIAGEPTISSNNNDTQSISEQNNENEISTGNYAVNGKNGKIHIVGACAATKNGKGQMTDPVYFSTYEEAENWSKQNYPNQDKRKCGNCYK